MKFRILHENKGVMRVHFSQSRMSYEQADILLYYLHSNKLVTFAKVYERTADTTVKYVGNSHCAANDDIHVLNLIFDTNTHDFCHSSRFFLMRSRHSSNRVISSSEKPL